MGKSNNCAKLYWCLIFTVLMVALVMLMSAGCRAQNIDQETLDQPPVVSETDNTDPVVSALERMRSKAIDLVGIRYRYGGASPQSGFDCSGFVQYVIRHAAGFTVGRTAASMATKGRWVAHDQLRVGDLVFFNTLGRMYSHVGIYLGGGQFAHAPSTGGRVRVEALASPYWRAHYTGARRLLQ